VIPSGNKLSVLRLFPRERWRSGAVVLMAGILLLLWPFRAAAVGHAPPSPLVPQFVFKAPQELAGTVRTLSRIPPSQLLPVVNLLGLSSAGGPIEVELLPEASASAKGTPAWVAGYAIPSEGRIVLFPARSPGYPDGSLENVLVHELVHVLIFRAAKGNSVPRWFHEGLAMFAARERSFEDRARLVLEVAFRDPPTLSQLDAAFMGDPAEVRRAYAISGAFFRSLVERQGAGIAARILREASTGIPFEEAFRRGTGDAAIFTYFDFWQSFRAPEAWLPIVTSTTVLWFGITVLAIYAMRKQRKRDAAVRKAWEDEEEARRQRQAMEVLEEFEDEKPPN
jgi:hypothetical protein